MKECECVTAAADGAPLVHAKRVSYPFGMVLGVDEFLQEQLHFEWKHRLSNRLLHGYGTVCGLKVTAHAVGGPEVEIRISRGAAVTPSGKWIWVERDQCARLSEWLAAHASEVSPPLSAGAHTVYVTLCAVDCPTDLKPIAGQPCAAEEDTRAASRILETFRAQFSWQRPAQKAEDAFRELGELLSRVDIVREPLAPDDGELLLELVHALAHPDDPMPVASPPPARFRLWAGSACDTLHRLLTIWTTEICPELESGEDCILLACVDFQADTSLALIPASVEVDDCTRPILVPDRLKQELFCFTGREGATGPTGPTGATGPQGPPGGVTVRSASVNLGRVPRSETRFFQITNPFKNVVPITLAVDPEGSEPPLNPWGQFERMQMNVALTVYNPTRMGFVIGATNLSTQRDFDSLRVRWWAFDV